MKIKIILYLGIFFILTATNLFAKENNLAVSVSLVGMSMDYKEYDNNGDILDSEESDYLDLGGVEISLGYIFTHEMASYSNLNFNLMLLNGDTVYRGSYLGSGQPYGSVVSTTQNKVLDTDISYKYNSVFKNNIELSYGLGFGYREWERALSASQVEVYKWYSVRPMIGLGYIVNNSFDLGMVVEYQYGFDTIMTLSNPSLDFTLGGADIWELTIPLTYQHDKNVKFFLEAVFQQQTIVKSNVNSGYYEPDSTAYNNYLKFGLGFKF